MKSNEDGEDEENSRMIAVDLNNLRTNGVLGKAQERKQSISTNKNDWKTTKTHQDV